MDSPRDTRPLAALGVALFAIVLARTAWLEATAFRAFHAMEQGAPLEDAAFRAHPLWNLLLGIAVRITGENFFSPLAVAAALSVAAVGVLLFRIAPAAPAVILITLAAVSSTAFVDYATSGLPYPLIYLLLALFCWLYFREKTAPETDLALGLLAALLALTQWDTLILTLPALLWTLYARRALQSTLLVFAGLLPFLLWLALYLALKPADPGESAADAATFAPAQGFWYFLYTLRHDPLTLAIIAAGAAAAGFTRDGRSRVLLAGLIAALLFIALSGGSAMAGREFAPLVLVGLVLCARLPRLHTPAIFGAALISLGALALLNPNPPLASATIFGEDPAKAYHEIRDERDHTFQSRSLYQWRRGAEMPLTNIEPKNAAPPRKPKTLPPPDKLEGRSPAKGIPKMQSEKMKKPETKKKTGNKKRKRGKTN